MSPSAVAPTIPTVNVLPTKNSEAPRDIFSDGIRTSGQHNPIYEILRPYSDFPREISGPTIWTNQDYENNTERWIHRLTASEIEELGATSDEFIASGTPLTGISKASEPLGKVLAALRTDLLNGKGFILFKGFPSDAWGLHKSAVAYLGLGTYIGYFVSQNSRGHILGHVKDVGDDPTQIDKVRIYRTTARQFFHADDGDIVGLLCMQKAQEGGDSHIVSIHNVWNTLQREHPDVAELLTQPIWYFDRKGEVSHGQQEWTRQPVFYIENSGKERVYIKWDPYYVRSLARFSDRGIIPPLSSEQIRAMSILEETCQRLALHMVLDVGDIQFLSNTHLLHARTAYRGS
ncbi:hypothetical protein Cpir12675_006599 [Ceratocystis pirilliformis]|uniref:TauD/TfdA-like domain-containing protein n=1 Tax=Ceratocystis pirilliformis TaxID=259994 RepID=A0ABR3YG51_9PEZI